MGLCTDQFDHPAPEERPAASTARLTLLLSYTGGDPARTVADAVEQVATLLAPFGIASVVAGSGEEAAQVIQRQRIHIAVVDWGIPMRREALPGSPAGGRVLQLLRRLDPAPPVVLVRPPQPVARDSARGLSEALREGAFAVVDRPVHPETLLEVLRRIVRRHYRNHWPAA